MVLIYVLIIAVVQSFRFPVILSTPPQIPQFFAPFTQSPPNISSSVALDIFHVESLADRFIVALEALTIFFLLIGIIVLPATLFNTSDSGRNRCRLVLSGGSGLNGEALSDARMGCQCVLAAVIFDGLSVYVPFHGYLIQGEWRLISLDSFGLRV